MAYVLNSKISTTDSLILGVIQIMIGIFHALMWYFVFFLYSVQVQGVFGTYEPITYKTGSTLWGVIFIISGILIIKSAKHPDYSLVLWSVVLNIISLIISIISVILIIIELSKFRSVSYRNYGQAKLGREVSRILILSYHLEMSITFVYSVFTCINLVQRHDDASSSEDQPETIL